MIHIHNGDITAAMARKAGLPGEHVAFREALVAGPIREDETWISTRARFLAEAHQHDLLRMSNTLFEQEQMLASLALNMAILTVSGVYTAASAVLSSVGVTTVAAREAGEKLAAAQGNVTDVAHPDLVDAIGRRAV